jgi:hypothetical protein
LLSRHATTFPPELSCQPPLSAFNEVVAGEIFGLDHDASSFLLQRRSAIGGSVQSKAVGTLESLESKKAGTPGPSLHWASASPKTHWKPEDSP